jgi:hypothetical protein
MVEYCDMNNDGTIDGCELHACVVRCENEWRDEHCPNFPHVACDCPFQPPQCGQWNCADVLAITNDAMANLDTNQDGQINYGDALSDSDIEMINEYCDENGDGVTDKCELY